MGKSTFQNITLVSHIDRNVEVSPYDTVKYQRHSYIKDVDAELLHFILCLSWLYFILRLFRLIVLLSRTELY